jgi:hypothetical protein
VICGDLKVLDYSLMMNIHTCISSKYFISSTITTIVDSVKLMNTSVEQLLLQEFTHTACENKRRRQFP